jgi:hypothetical protein
VVVNELCLRRSAAPSDHFFCASSQISWV